MCNDIPYYKLLNTATWWLIPGIKDKQNNILSIKSIICNPIIIQNQYCIRCVKKINLGFNFKNHICCISCYDFYTSILNIGNISTYIMKREINE